MLEILLNKIERARKEFFLFRGGEKILLAVSGGPDSVFLLYSMTRLSEKYGLKLAVAHFNHMLRGKESDLDEQFVGELACRYRLPFFSERFPVMDYAEKERLNLEDAARKLRYDFLERKLREWKGDLIATGHTLSDNVETAFLNLLRGSDLTGISGIRPRRGNIIRPLFFISRREVLSFLDAHEIPYRVDRTNLDSRYKRNFLRNEVFPLLRMRFGDFECRVSESTLLFQEETNFLNALAHQLIERAKKASYPDELLLDRHVLLNSEPVLVRWAFHNITKSGYRAIKNLLNLLTSDGKVHFEGGLKAEVSMGEVRFYKEEKSLENSCEMERGVCQLPEINALLIVENTDKRERNTPFAVYFGHNQVHPPFLVRKRRSGDRIRMKAGTKKLKELFIDKKVPRWRRDLIPVVEDRKGIVWVAGIQKAWRPEIERKPFVKMEVRKSDPKAFWIYDI